jgi:hypothetical protein
MRKELAVSRVPTEVQTALQALGCRTACEAGPLLAVQMCNALHAAAG